MEIRNGLAKIGLIASCLILLPAIGMAEENAELLGISPSGAYRVEVRPNEPVKPGEEPTSDVWLISTKDSSQGVALPKQAPDSPTDDEIHFSPNEEWIFGLRHVGSGLRYGNIYHLLKPLRIEVVGKQGYFDELVWEQGVKTGALKENYSAAGVYAMTFFGGWSIDSSRLLIRLCGGEEKRDMRCGLFYFNTRTNKFEATDYSRKLSRNKSKVLTCAEPVDPLPSEDELKKKFDALDQQLNKRYAEVLAKTDKDRVSVVREAQRDWLKERDAGEKFYLALFPASEKSRRRLQFLCGVTAARIDTPAEQWE
jgi:uncharacterized protein YecT (DUF1311 family)